MPLAYRAVFWSPGSAAAQTTLGTVLLTLGQLDAARARFLTARRLAPYAGFASNNLCVAELRRGRAADAVPYCQQAATLDPSSQIVRNNLATAYVMVGDDDAAFAVFAAGPTPAVAAYNQGVLWLAKGEADRAREAFARARLADPSFRPPLSQLRQLSSTQEPR
ncbi:MAG: tetratricopeptide repeat protein [Vicinamibacterales bacterium]